MREARDLFHNADFIEKMDQNPYLLDLKMVLLTPKEKRFRQGYGRLYYKINKMDYGVPKEKIKNYETKKKEIEYYMETFSIPELRNYMWDHLASTLIGINHDQTFNIYTGSGSNGKSILVTLMEEMALRL